MCIPFTTVYVKYAFKPMPGARAMGYRARTRPSGCCRRLRKSTSPPAPPGTASPLPPESGIYKYDVRHGDQTFVLPPSISVRQLVPKRSNSKYCSSRRSIAAWYYVPPRFLVRSRRFDYCEHGRGSRSSSFRQAPGVLEHVSQHLRRQLPRGRILLAGMIRADQCGRRLVNVIVPEFERR